jgi:hypothetical protein
MSFNRDFEHIVLALGEATDFGVQNFQYIKKVDASYSLQLTTSLAIE